MLRIFAMHIARFITDDPGSSSQLGLYVTAFTAFLSFLLAIITAFISARKDEVKRIQERVDELTRENRRLRAETRKLNKKYLALEVKYKVLEKTVQLKKAAL
jgi:hypothetical protein